MSYQYFTPETSFYKVLAEIIAIDDLYERMASPKYHEPALAVLKHTSPYFRDVVDEAIHVLQFDKEAPDTLKMMAMDAICSAEFNMDNDPNYPGGWQTQPEGTRSLKLAMDNAARAAYQATHSQALRTYFCRMMGTEILEPHLPNMLRNASHTVVAFTRKSEP